MARILPVLGLVPALLLPACTQSDGGQPDQAAASNTVIAETPAATTDAGSRPTPAEAHFIKLEQDYAKALMHKDRAFLMAYYAPDWRGGNWLGFWTKSTMLKAVLDERYVVRSMKLRDLRVRVVGEAAIVQGISDEVTAVDGKETSGKWSFTDVFTLRDGRWVATASHTSEVKQRQ